MGYLKTLAELPDGKFVVNLGEVRLKVGTSDKNAAERLIKFIDEFADGNRTNGEGLYRLTVKWLETLNEAMDTMPPQEAMDVPEVAAWWDALWWFRFLIALDDKPKSQAALDAAGGTE